MIAKHFRRGSSLPRHGTKLTWRRSPGGYASSSDSANMAIDQEFAITGLIANLHFEVELVMIDDFIVDVYWF